MANGVTTPSFSTVDLAKLLKGQGYAHLFFAEAYTLKYDKNAVDATGSMGDQVVAVDATATLAENAYA